MECPFSLIVILLVQKFSCCFLVTKSCPTLATPLTVPARLLCSWDFPGKNTGVGCHFLLQGLFQTQGSSPCLLHWHWQAVSCVFFFFLCSLLLHLICEALGVAQTPHRAQGESTGCHSVLQPSPTPTSPLPQVLRHEQALSLPPQLENRFGPAQIPAPVWLPGHSQTS